jgi:hypothetical protein
MSDYGRKVQVVITIQNTTLSPEELKNATYRAMSRQRLLVDGDTVSAYLVDCECRYCNTDNEEVSA